MKKIDIAAVLGALGLVLSVAATCLFVRAVWVYGQPHSDLDHVLQTLGIQFAFGSWLVLFVAVLVVVARRYSKR